MRIPPIPGGTGGATAPAVLDGTGDAANVPLTIINGKTASGLVVRVSGTAPSGVVLQNASSVRSGFFGHAVAGNDWTPGSAAVDLVIGNDLGGVYIRALGSQGVKLRSASGNGKVNVDDSTGTAMLYGATSLSADSTGILVSGGNPLTISMGTSLATSGTKQAIALTATFGPTSGNADWRQINSAYTVNQTGGANGTVTGIFANATETAVVGTHNLIDLQVGGTSKFKVDNTGLPSFGAAKIALGGGSAPTLGTIGGSGPATAAQNAWIKEVRNGVTLYIPVWT